MSHPALDLFRSLGGNRDTSASSQIPQDTISGNDETGDKDPLATFKSLSVDQEKAPQTLQDLHEQTLAQKVEADQSPQEPSIWAKLGNVGSAFNDVMTGNVIDPLIQRNAALAYDKAHGIEEPVSNYPEALKLVGQHFGEMLDEAMQLGSAASSPGTAITDPKLLAKFQNLREEVLPAIGAQVRGVLPTSETFSSWHGFVNTGPIAGAGNLLWGLAGSPLNSLFETISGVDPQNNFRSLTPEKQADAIQQTAALAATMGVAKLLHVETPGNLIQRAVRGSAGAGAGGFTYGLVSEAGKDDQLTSAFSSAALFAPIGGMLDMMFGARAPSITSLKNEEALNNLRILQANTESTVGEITNKTDAVATSNSIPEAAIKVALNNDVPTVVRGVEDGPNLALAFSRSDRPVWTRNGENGWDILVEGKNKLSKDDVALWKRTGFFPGQPVSINGTYFRIEGLETPAGAEGAGTMRLVARDGTVVHLPIESIRDLNTHEFHDQEPTINPDGSVSGFAYRGVEEGANPLTRRFQSSIYMSASPSYAAMFGAGGTLNEISYNFKKPLIVDASADADLHQGENSKIMAQARANGNDGIIVKRHLGIGPDEIIALDESAVKLHKVIVKDINGFNDVKYYRNKIVPELMKGKDIKDILKEHLPESVKNEDIVNRLMAIHEMLGGRLDPAVVIHNADTNGFTVERDGPSYVLRDATSNDVVGRFNSPNEMLTAITKAGQVEGNAIDGMKPASIDGGDGNVPPTTGIRAVPEGQPPDNRLSPWAAKSLGRLEKIGAHFAIATPWIQPIRAFAIAVDKLYNTEFFNKVYMPTQTALLKKYAALHVALGELKEINDGLKGLSKDRRAVVSQYREAMSPDDVIHNYMAREMNNTEIDYARNLAGKDGSESVDFDKIFDYRRQSKPLEELWNKALTAVENNKDNPGIQKIQQNILQQREAALKDLADRIGLSDKELKTVNDFNDISQRESPKDMSIGAVVRLAKSYMNNEVGRDDFAVKNKMNAAELLAANRLDGFYAKYAKTFNIPDVRMLGQYMNHYRRYGEAPDVYLGPTLKGKTTVKDFLSNLHRTGEITDYIDDPIEAASAYLQQGYNHLYMNAVNAASRNYAVNNLFKIPGAAREHIAKVLNYYLTGVRGIPDPTNSAMSDAWDGMMDTLGIKMAPKLKNDIINGMLSWTNASLLGYKPELALRDGGTWASMYYSRFGARRALNAMKYAFEQDANGVTMADKLAAEGINPHLSPVGIFTPEELAALDGRSPGALGSALSKMNQAALKVGQLGLKLSGQQNFYGKIHAGAYLEAKRLAVDVLTKLGKNEITKDKAYEILDLHSYDGPVAQAFDNLVTKGKYVDAADYLGRVTAVETAFIHGLSNHPYMWGTIPGRLLGQYGTWSMWARNYMFRLASRGTAAQRLAAILRFVASQAAIHAAGSVMGVNLHAWQVLPGLVFTGGPIVGNTLDMVDLSGLRGSRRQRDQITSMLYNMEGFRNMFVPGSYAFHDWLLAKQLYFNKDFGLLRSFGAGLGFSIDQTKRSFLDDWMGNDPKLRNPPKDNSELARKIIGQFPNKNLLTAPDKY